VLQDNLKDAPGELQLKELKFKRDSFSRHTLSITHRNFRNDPFLGGPSGDTSGRLRSKTPDLLKLLMIAQQKKAVGGERRQ